MHQLHLDDKSYDVYQYVSLNNEAYIKDLRMQSLLLIFLWYPHFVVHQ